MADSAGIDGATAAGTNEFINLKVVGQDSKEYHFRVKYSTRLIKLKKSYADRIGVDVETLRFLFDGNHILDNDTPRSLELDEDDIIEAFQLQHGGSGG